MPRFAPISETYRDAPAVRAELRNLTDVYSQSLLRVHLSRQSIRVSDALISDLTAVWIGLDDARIKKHRYDPNR